jgi:ribosomal protein S18 acetylase RimI-like enzyme
MDDAAFVAVQRTCQRRYYASLVGTPQTRLHHGDGGVQALITPGAPGVSFLNGVVYEDGPALVAALDELDAMYVDAGVKAWTVWVHHDDDDTGPACEARGHKLDGTPAPMVGEIAQLDLEPRHEVEISTEPDWVTLGDVNGVAYGGPRGVMGQLFIDVDQTDYVTAIAYRDGTPLACTAGQITDGNCEILFVATDPDARRQGLAGECMTSVLRRAMDAGATTTTLEASALGEPVYARMGYRTIGRMTIWERRRAAEAASEL